MARRVKFSPCVALLASLAVAAAASSTNAQTMSFGGAMLFAPPPLPSAGSFPAGRAKELLPRSMVPYLAKRFEPASEESAEAKPAVDPSSTEPESPELKSAQPNSETTTLDGHEGNPEVDNAPAEASSEKENAAPAEPDAEPESRPQLRPEMAEFRDRIRRTILFYATQPFNTESNTAADVLQFCTAFGCDSEIRAGSARGKGISAIGTLAWNYPCGGFRMLATDGRQVVARVGYGLQQNRGEFLAMLAMSQVSPEYEVRIGEQRGTVAHLILTEQLNCQSGTDQSFVLTGLAYYLPDNEPWQDDLGQTWSLDRLIAEELDRDVDAATAESVYRLIGLTAAARRCTAGAWQPTDETRRGAEYVRNFEKYALELQNADGTWNPAFFAAQGTSSDSLGVLQSTGHILEWLAISLPNDELQTAPILSAVNQVNHLLTIQASRKYIYALTPGEIRTMMHAVHALVIYDQRVFKPFDPIEPAAEEAAAQ